MVLRDHETIQIDDQSGIDKNGNAETNNSIQQKGFGALALQGIGCKVTSQQKESRHEIRLVKCVENYEQDRAQLIRDHVSD